MSFQNLELILLVFLEFILNFEFYNYKTQIIFFLDWKIHETI
jgi:hypothetical protein